MKKSGASVFWTGARLGIPVILGYIPVGIAYALIARQAGFSVLETCMMSVFVYAGASEMMAAGMYAQGAGIAAIVLATFILNLRHFIMSACVMNGMRSEKRAFKELAAFCVTDEVFAIYTTQKKLERPGLVFLGMALISYLSWNLGTVIGAVASDFLPALLTAALGVAMYAMFISLLCAKRTWKRAAGASGAADGGGQHAAVAVPRLRLGADRVHAGRSRRGRFLRRAAEGGRCRCGLISCF